MFKPNREFQAGLNTTEARRQREKNSLSLRRKDREIKLQNKRKKILNRSNNKGPTDNNNTNTNANNSNNNNNYGSQQTLQNDQQQQMRMLQDLPRYVQGCFTENQATMFECTQKIRKLLSFAHNVPIKQVIDSGVVPRLIQFLHKNNMPQLQFETLWVLTNIASSDKPEYTAKIVRDGALQPIMKILQRPNYALQEQAIWGLGNIAGDCLELRNNLLENGVLQYLVECCKQEFNDRHFANYGANDTMNNGEKLSPQQQYVTLFKNLSWSISNFCRYGGHNNRDLSGLLECLFHLLSKHRDIILEDDNNPYDQESFGGNIGWSFTYLTNSIDFDEDNNEIIRIMNENGITAELIKLLGSKNIYTVHSTLRAVGNILTGSDKYTMKCIEYGVLPYLKTLMIDYHQKTVNNINSNGGRTSYDTKLKELCWAISNITAGPREHIIEIMKQEFTPILIKILAGSRSIVSSEALWALSNATAGADKQIMQYLVQQGLIKGLCKYFENKYKQQQYHQSQDKLLMVALECIDGILTHDTDDHKYGIEFEEYGGINFLEYLQSDDNINEAIYDKAVGIIKLYFGGEDDDDIFGANTDVNEVNIDCNINGNQFGFGLNTNNNDNNTNDNNANKNNNNTSNTFQF